MFSNKKRCIAIIQARMGSKRLPGKSMMDIEGKPMVRRVYDRVKQAKLVKEVTICTSADSIEIHEYCRQNLIPAFAGSEDDVLDRYYRTAWMWRADPIVRITADCPLIDPAIIDNTIAEYYNNMTPSELDFTYNYEYPDGMDVEVFSFRILEMAWNVAKTPEEREHVTKRIRELSGWKTEVADRPHWSVDTADDMEFVRGVYRNLGDGFNYEKLKEYIRSNDHGLQ